MPVDYHSPAFPSVIPEDREAWYKGLTMREYFAAHAMAALVSLPSSSSKNPIELADRAFKIASAMMVRANVRE